VTFNPVTRVPIGVLAGMYVLYSDVTVATGALLAAVGVTLARIVLALAAKRPNHQRKLSPEARAREEAMHAWLGSNPQFVRISFLMGALPFVPSRVTFPMLGAIGAPLRWAVLGSLSGSTLVLFVTTWFSTAVAVAIAGTAQAATFLGITALTLVVLRMLGSLDGDAWRSERKLRMRDEKSSFNFNMFGPGMGGGGAGSGFGYGSSGAMRDADPQAVRGEDDDGEFYEGEVVGEEIFDDDLDRQGGATNGDPKAELPPGDRD